MGVVNTTKSIFEKAMGHQAAAPEAEVKMPEQPAPDEIGPDEVEEDERDREGNTDPGTNVPVEDPEAAEIRRAALQQAADDINAAALAQAKIDAEPRTVPAQAIKLHAFKYLSIADSKGMFHVTGTDGKGAAFTVTEDAPPNATIDDLLHYIADMSVKYG
jgi:hypothetical protein